MYPVQTLNSEFHLVAGKFTTDSTGAVLTTDLPFVKEVTVANVTVGTSYILHLSETYSECMYLHATTNIGHIIATSHNVTSTTDPTFTLYPRSPFSVGPHVIQGGHISDPTTPSTQATGAGDTEVRVNIAASDMCIVDSLGAVYRGVIAAAPDFVLHSGSKLLDEGQSVIYQIVAKGPSGIMEYDAVQGVVATTGNEVAPDAAAIGAGLGLSTVETADWVRLGRVTVARTGDTVLAQTTTVARYNNPMLSNPYETTPFESQRVAVLAVLVR